MPTTATAKKVPAIFSALLEGKLGSLKPALSLKMLRDARVPPEHRAELLLKICAEQAECAGGLLGTILEAADGNADEAVKQRAAKLEQLLEEMEAGPLRTGRFVRMIERNGGPPRALVALHDGALAASVVPDDALAGALRRGDGVLLDGQGRAVLHRDLPGPTTGETVVLERRLGDDTVVVSLGHDERRVMWASEQLVRQLDDGSSEPGATLLASARQGFAFAALPTDDDFAHERFLDRAARPVPVEMASPPAYVDALVRHAEIALRRPDLIRAWDQSFSSFALLQGVTGSGKTMSIDLLHHRLATLTSEVTGVPVEDLPPMLFRLEPSAVYSKWLGDSDRNLARFFDEVARRATTPYVSPRDGRRFERLPVIAVIEEIDGMARARGSHGDPVYDRIMVTLLQRMDLRRPGMRDGLVFFLSTTNLPREVDTAAARRAGGIVETFGHLTRDRFAAMIDVLLRRLRLAPRDGESDPEQLRRRITAELAGRLYGRSPDDPGQAEVIYANAEPQIVHRRDLLTGAIVARSVSAAAREACHETYGGADAGLDTERLLDAIDAQVTAVTQQMGAHNIGSFIALKEGAHVTEVRRISRPALLPSHFRRAS